MGSENPASEAKTQDLEKAPAIGIQLSTQLGPDKALNLSCWLPLDASVRDLNATLDKFWNAADRLEARSKIVVLEKTIEALERDRVNARKNIAKLDFAAEVREHESKASGRQGKPKAPANEAETRRAYETAIEEYTDKIAKFTVDLADLKRVAYGVPDGGADLRTGEADRQGS